MAGTHILQHIFAFALALWWTKHWLISRPVSRWRFIIAALSGSIIWVYVAWTATSVVDASSGVVVEYTSLPLAYFAAFMAFVSVVGMIVGLLFWTEEEVTDMTNGAPDYLNSNLGDD